jgi:hypothetical protein
MKVMDKHDGMKCITASAVAKSMSWLYGVNFKLVVIKYAEETSNCTAAWKFCHITEYTWLDKMKTTTNIIKGSKFNVKCIYWAQAGKFQLELMLEKCRNGLVAREMV